MADISRDLWSSLKKVELSHTVNEVKATLGGSPVAAQPINIVVTTTAVAVWEDSVNAGTLNGVWFCLATFQITIPLPPGLPEANGNIGSQVRHGAVRIEIAHDRSQKSFLEGIETMSSADLKVSCDHIGPGASQNGGSKSSTVSQNVGVNIGAFSDLPTAGVSYSQDLSNTISVDLHDVEITSDLVYPNDSAWWNYDFSAMHDSAAARSTFDQTVQTIWRYEPTVKGNMSKMAFNVKVHWTPWAYWTANGHHYSEGLGAADPAQCKVVLDNSVIPFTIPPATKGVKKTTSA